MRSTIVKHTTELFRIATYTILSIAIQSFSGSLIAQDYQNGLSVFQSKIDDAAAVYFQKENFELHSDGIGDDAPALQAAINLMQERSSDGYGIVLIPEGTYRLGETVYLWRGIRLVGYGKSRPVFILGDSTPGFQEGSGNYMIQFCDRRFKEGEAVNDAANTTYFSGIDNINIVIEDGNPAAVAVRYHVAQHCSLNNMDFQIGSALAAVEDIGNVIENCNFYGGKWGIKTGMTSPGWQALVLDCTFKAQREASIHTQEAGLTVIRCKFYDSPKSILVPSKANERLFIKDCFFENISQSAINVNNYFDPLTQLNFENLLFSNVPISLEYYGGFGHGTNRTIPIPDKDIDGVVNYKALGSTYRINDYSHGLIIEYEGAELKRELNTIIKQEKLELLNEIPERDYPTLPTMDNWVNIVDLGARGDGKTDNTKIFKEAIAKYNTIYIPMGNYVVSENLLLKQQTSLIGLHPSSTRISLLSNSSGFNSSEKPNSLLITPKGGSNIVSGIGFFPGINPGAISVKWMAGSKSYMNDTFFSYSKATKKTEGEYYGLWITDGGGGTFKNIWCPNQQGRRGLLISNTTEKGRMYEISVEHHREVEIDIENVSNWEFYNMQTEVDGGSEKSISVNIDNCSNLSFANNLSYRVKVMQTPAIAAFVIKNAKNIIIKGSHVFSWGTFPYDNSIYIKDKSLLVSHHDFTKFRLK